MTELRSFTRQHLEGTLALFTAEDWQTYTAAPSRFQAFAWPANAWGWTATPGHPPPNLRSRFTAISSHLRAEVRYRQRIASTATTARQRTEGCDGNRDRGDAVSLDGFVSDRRGSAGRLYPDLADLRDTDHMNAAIEATGAVVIGRRTFEMGDPDSYVGNYEFQVPVPSRLQFVEQERRHGGAGPEPVRAGRSGQRLYGSRM
jgi:hypothetical protein